MSNIHRKLFLLVLLLTPYLCLGQKESNSKEIFYKTMSIAQHFLDLADYDSALVFAQHGHNLALDTFSEKDEELPFSAYMVGVILMNLSEYQKALPYIKSQCDLYEKKKRREISLGECYHNLAFLHSELGNYDQVINLLERSYEQVENHTSMDSLEYANMIFSLGEMYEKIGFDDKALTFFEKSWNVLIKINALYKDLLKVGNSLFLQYQRVGLHKKAFQISTRLSNYEDLLKAQSVKDYFTLTLNKAHYSMELGDFEKAKSLIFELMDLPEYEEYMDKDTHFAIQFFFTTGNLLMLAEEFDYAMAHFLSAKEAAEKLAEFEKKNSRKDGPINGELSKRYSVILKAITDLLTIQGRYSEAEKLGLTAIAIMERSDVFGVEHIEYAKTLKTLHDVTYAQKKYDFSLRFLTMSIEILSKKLGNDHEYTRYIRGKIARVYWKIGDFDNAREGFLGSVSGFAKNTEEIMSFATDQGKYAYLNANMGVFSKLQDYAFQTDTYDQEYIEVCLNLLLTLKGILWRNSIDILPDLRSLKSQEIDISIALYEALKKKLSQQYSLSQTKRKSDIDSIKSDINKLETELLGIYVDEFGSIGISHHDWQQIQSSLNEGDVAIEFSSFNLSNIDSLTEEVANIAYLITKTQDVPIVIKLPLQEEIEHIFRGTVSATPQSRGAKSRGIITQTDLTKLYQLIWKPIAPYLKDVKTIYYSTDGVLHQLPLAALKDSAGITLNDTYNLVQVASTNSLVESQVTNIPEEAVLIGGVEYNLTNDEEPIKEQSHFYGLPRGPSNLEKGSGWAYLEGSEDEVKAISILFQTNGKTNTLLTGKNATEEKFKAISGNSPEVIHIATHGFFFEDKEVKEPISLFQPHYSLADEPLIRSGLILAGGNNAWIHGSDPNQEEDGILTALEISQMDLSGTSLVVLSACETALGDILTTEGVFGLQRAFRMAGVENIIMSLWEVPDKETAEFMEVFYSRWLGGSPLRKAFNETQRVMAKKYKNEPQKWAGFVLVS